MPEPEITSDVAALTVQLLSAYLSNNTVASDDLAGLIRSTRDALTQDPAKEALEPDVETFTPAVSVRKSLASPDHIVSMIDGKSYKTLKRHLSANGLTPDEYRRRYSLPASYPMVAPAYSAHRRDVAQKIGLGSRNAALLPDAPGEPEGAADQVADATSNAPALTKSAPTAKAKSPAKAKRQAAAATDKPAAPGTGEPTPDAPVSDRKARRKGKLALFGASDAGSPPVDDGTSSEDAGADDAQAAGAVAPSKAKSSKPKRTAGKPKVADLDPVESSGTDDVPSVGA